MSSVLPSARLNALTLKNNIPVSVTIELTRRCPLSCRHCYLPETGGRRKPGRELATAQWKKVLEQVSREGGLYLVFTGGEPLLRPDLPELCRYAKKLNFDVRVFSSGLGLTPALAAELADAGVSGFELSLYGRAAVHDNITGRSGSHAETLRAARLLKKSGLKVKLKAPLMSLNRGEAPFLKRLARKEGFGISFDPVLAPANDGEKSVLAYRLSGKKLEAALRAVPPAPGRAGDNAGEPDLICGAGHNVCAVDPCGGLYPCLQIPVRLGNILKKGFAPLWKRSPWLKKWRALSSRDLKACVNCRVRDYCSFCPGISLIEEDSPLAPNKAACEMAAVLRKKAEKRRGKKRGS